MRSNLPKLIVIVGPTASGKSDLAVELARRLRGEVISADSRQVYKGLDIGSGKITRKEMLGVPHHLLDVASPKKVFTVTQYKKRAEKAIKDIVKRGKVPILVGGTGLYIDAVLYDQEFPKAKPNPKLRSKLEKFSTLQLFSRLEELDPTRAANIDKNNKRRLIRALEIVLTTGKPVPSATTKEHSPFLAKLKIEKGDILKLGLAPEQQILRKKIIDRLLSRIKAGMLSEVKQLRSAGISWKRLEDLGLEYRWTSYYLRGLLPKKEMIKMLGEREIPHYAKRQMTWFKRDKEIKWFPSSKECLSSIFLSKP